MKNLLQLILLLFSLSLFYSCTKKHDFTFKGRVTNNFNGAGVPNVGVHISRKYDIGHGEIDDYGATYTNNDGYYELNTKVSEKGSSIYYQYQLLESDLTAERHDLGDNGANIEGNKHKTLVKNLEAWSKAKINYHIKNVNPVDSNDLFRSVTLLDLINLKGTSIDTHIITYTKYFPPGGYFSYQYYYYKGGVYFTSPVDSIFLVALSTVNVDINY